MSEPTAEESKINDVAFKIALATGLSFGAVKNAMNSVINGFQDAINAAGEFEEMVQRLSKKKRRGKKGLRTRVVEQRRTLKT